MKMSNKRELNPREYASFLLAEAQHAKGVTVRINPQNYKIEYINPDGSIVPNFEHFYNKVINNN